MTSGINPVVYPVRDLAQAKALYGKLLGIEPYADTPYYVGFRLGDQELALDPNGHARGMTGAVAFCAVDDIRATLRLLVDAGAQTQQEVTDVGGGKLIAMVKDPDGNVVGLSQEP
jgi:predicted enzyme related to lactoylglutathione lyase